MTESDAAVPKADTPRRSSLRQRWKALEPTIPSRPFLDYAWENFDPKAVASHLLLPSNAFYRHKSILHDGFCAWVACPSRRKLREDSMIHRVAKALDDAEAPWRAGADSFVHSIGETVGRLLGADRRFFEEVYYPVGGGMRLVRAVSPSALRRLLVEHATDMLEAVHLMALHHYHLTHLQDKKLYHVPSKEAGAALVKSAFGAPTTQRFVEGLLVKNKAKPKEKTARSYKLHADTLVVSAWNVSREAVAYSYAAASIETGEGRTLLHDIIACKSTRAKHQHLMQEWCGRARYAVENIIERCHPEAEPFPYRLYVPDVEPIPFELPTLFPFNAVNIEQGYKNAIPKRVEQRLETLESYRKKNTPGR